MHDIRNAPPEKTQVQLSAPREISSKHAVDLAASPSLAERFRAPNGRRVTYEPPSGMEIHPALNCFPMMTEDEFARLVWSIRKIGLIHPIVKDKATGMILDGRCRLKACEVAGIEPRLAPPKDRVAAYLFGANVARRHLPSEGQRAMIFVMIENSGIALDDDLVHFIWSANCVRRHFTRSQLAMYDAMVEEPDYTVPVMPEARLVLEYPALAESVRGGGMPLTDAFEKAREYKQGEKIRRERAERLEQFRVDAPLLAMRVDNGELTLETAVETASEEAAAPILAEHAEAIRTIGKRVLADLLEIGRRLTECRVCIRHGRWGDWLREEFGWSDSTASRYMQAYELSTKSPNLGNLDLPISGLYLLAQPSTPDKVREEILSRAQTERIPHAEVKRLIDDARGKPAQHRFRSDLRDIADRMAEVMPDDPLVAELLQLVSGEPSP